MYTKKANNFVNEKNLITSNENSIIYLYSIISFIYPILYII